MTTESQQQREELRDRLLDQMLSEVAGGEQPPDLSERIVAASCEEGIAAVDARAKSGDYCITAITLIASQGLISASDSRPLVIPGHVVATASLLGG